MQLKSIKNKFWQLLFLMSVMVMGWSCDKDENVDLFVDDVLREYFDQFAVEGAERGVVVDFTASRIEGFLRLITTQGVIGQCAHQEDKPNTVIIDKIYWNTATDLEREFVVFHELGHCVLNREHLDDSDTNGNCISMMTSGTGLCHIQYTTATRESMLNELFQ